MKRKAIYLLLFLLLILTSLLWFFTKAFATLHSAGSLLQLPKQENVYEGVDPRIIKAIQLNLPAGATLTLPPEYSDRDYIIEKDLNDDGRNEIVYCYKNYPNEGNISISVLYNKGGIWYKALQIDKELLDLELIKFANITNDNHPELIIGWKEKNSQWNGLDIYKWEPDRLVNVYSTAYSKLSIDNQRSNKFFGDRDKLIIWKDNGMFRDEDVITWNISNFVSVSEFYPEDFKDLLQYYRDLEKNNKNQSSYWYARAGAAMSAADYKEADNDIDKALSLNKNQAERLSYMVVKGNCQSYLSNFSPDRTLINVINDISKIKDIPTKNRLLMDAYYYLGSYYTRKKDYKNAFTYYDLSMKRCEAVYGDNEEVFKLKVFKINKARTEAAACAYSKNRRTTVN